MSKAAIAVPTCSRQAASIPSAGSSFKGAKLVLGRRAAVRAVRDAVIRAAAPAATVEIAPPKAGEEELFKAINTIRFLSIDGVNKANSGHPGLPMGCAPMAYLIYNEYMKHNPKDPMWPNRDRFVLSAGHGSMLQYSLLHLTGYESVQVSINIELIHSMFHSNSGFRLRFVLVPYLLVASKIPDREALNLCLCCSWRTSSSSGSGEVRLLAIPRTLRPWESR